MRTCTLAIPALGGTTYTARFISYDTAPVSGVIPPSAKQLAIGAATATIVAGQLNSLSVTLNGSPHSIAAPAAQPVLAGAATAVSLTTTSVSDAAGNIIVGAFATPVAVSVTDTGAHTMLSINGGATRAASLVLASPTDASNLKAYYDGGGAAGYSATVSYSGTGVTTTTTTINRFGISGAVSFGTPTFTAGTPSAAAFSAPAQQITLTASESNFTGSFGVQSSTCGAIAAIASTSPTFKVTSSSFGTCAVTISDGTLNAVVNVTANETQSGVTVPPPSGTVSEYADGVANLIPTSITTGSDGNLWFVGSTSSAAFISRITPSGTITNFPLPPADINPVAIASGSDGNLWVVDLATDTVIVVNTSGSVVTTHAVGSNPFAIALGSDGAMWVTNTGSGTISCFAAGGTTTAYTIPNGASPTGITAGPDGAMWFADFSSPYLGRITTPCTSPGGGVFNQFPIAEAAGSDGITTGPDRALWFTDRVGSTVARMTTAGVYSNQGALAHAPSTNIVLGPDLNLWFGACGCVTDTLQRLTPSGTQTTFAAGPTTQTVDGLTVGPDGAIWYAGDTAGSTTVIGRVQP